MEIPGHWSEGEDKEISDSKTTPELEPEDVVEGEGQVGIMLLCLLRLPRRSWRPFRWLLGGLDRLGRVFFLFLFICMRRLGRPRGLS